MLNVPGVVWSAGPQNVVLVLSTTCVACEESVPFYRTLSSYLADQPSKRLIVLGYEDAPVMRRWLESNDVLADQILQFRDLLDLGLSLTPTFLMVDASGSVTDVFLGRLTETDEGLVMNRLKEATGASPIDNTVLLQLRAGDFRMDGL